MKMARTAAATIGHVVVLTSLLCLVLVLAAWIAGPALAIAIFSAVLLLSPFAQIPRPPVPVPVSTRRRRLPARAPPVF